MSIAKQKAWALNTIVLLLLLLTAVWLAANSTTGKAAALIQNVGSAALYDNVDLKYLIDHIEAFKSACVKVNGTVRYYASIYMFEDFWLQAGEGAKIPVVTRFAGLPTPPEGLFIEVVGQIEYCNLEGGFYFLNATSWSAIQQTPQPTLSATSPPPSTTIEPTNSPNPQEATPPAGSKPLLTQPSSSNIESFEYGALATLALVAMALFLAYLFYCRKKQRKVS